MKFLNFLAVFLVMNFSLHAQNYLNKNIDFNNTNVINGYTNMIVDNDTIYAVGFNNLGNSKGFYIDKLDDQASIINKKSFIATNTQYFAGGLGENLIKIDNSYYYSGSMKINNGLSTGLVYKFDNKCDTIFLKKRNKLGSIATLYRFGVKSDINFITLGYSTYFDTSLNTNVQQLYIIKLDTLANVIWEHEYGYPLVNEFVNGIKEANDGGFFIYGSKVNYQAYSEFYLLKVDSMGNLLWQRSWGNLYHDNILGFYELPNGNLIVSGQISDDYFGLEVSQAYLAMLTPDGNQRIWEKRFFWYTNTYALHQIFHNNNGTYDIWGYESNTDQGVDITRPFLMHFSANFDSLDTKFYSHWNGPGAQNYIRDIVKMPDQGYVACGFGWDNNNDQDGWLLRIDSNGCANVNCTPLAIQENNNDIINDVAIYPNPATDKIYIKTKPAEVIKSIRLFDISGTAIKAQITGNEIDVSILANGLYIIEITNAQDNIQRFKALKE